MDIKQLYYFTAVAQAGSYSKAAESLAVSQPTLSVTVKNWRRSWVFSSFTPSTGSST